jgi:hypothetical protein
LVAVALLLRASHGFTNFTEFFDDAWASLPAHESLAHAVRMTVSTPLWTLALRTWIRWGSNATWWAQIPSFVAGLLSLVLMTGLLRRRYRDPWVVGLSLLYMAGLPALTVYCTRVKPYTVELCLSSSSPQWPFWRIESRPSETS